MIPADIDNLQKGFHGVAPDHLAAIVTVLERRKPFTGTIAPRSDIALRQHDKPSLDWYRSLFRKVGGNWLWTSRLTLTDDELASHIHDTRIKIFSAESPAENGAAIGLLELDFRKSNSCEIALLGLVPEFVGRGFGNWVMENALSIAASHNIPNICVHTCTLDDPRALDFYRKWEFEPVRRAVEILPDPRKIGALPANCAPQHPLL